METAQRKRQERERGDTSSLTNVQHDDKLRMRTCHMTSLHTCVHVRDARAIIVRVPGRARIIFELLRHVTFFVVT